jgi:hypothetical protein
MRPWFSHPKSKVDVWSNTGHWIMQDRKDDVNAAVTPGSTRSSPLRLADRSEVGGQTSREAWSDRALEFRHCEVEPFDVFDVLESSGGLREANMDLPWTWEKIGNFGSLRERDCFVAWMRCQIASGISEEINPPADQRFEPGNRWFRHVPTGAVWRLVPIENPYGPGFWPADDDGIPHAPPPSVEDRRSWPPRNYR